MKTVFFFYYDKILNQTKCDCYLVSNIQACIDWKMTFYNKEIEKDNITNLTIKIADSTSFTTLTKM